jgi:GxxExxY protein
MSEIVLKEKSYKIIGVCMEVHTESGMGFKEAVYKEAHEIEFNNRNIPYEREKFLQSNIKDS